MKKTVKFHEQTPSSTDEARGKRLVQTVADAALDCGEEDRLLDEAIREMRKMVAEERRIARFRGQAWTPYRPFLSGVEMIGASRCCSCLDSGRRCRKVAAYVSYSTGIDGRVVRCELCHRQGIHVAPTLPPRASIALRDDDMAQRPTSSQAGPNTSTRRTHP